MPKPIYIAVGNHKSLVGINEIIYTLYSALSENLPVKLTRSLKPDAVNIIIDEFASSADLLAIEQTKTLYPNTKIVVVATEFVTPVTVLGVELLRTFNFFGNFRDWRVLVGATIRSLFGGMPPYMRLRYLGFIGMMKYCDLLAGVHEAILPTVAELVAESAPHLPAPLMVYPRITLSALQKNRLADLPVGFTMTGTQTRYRLRILRELIKSFKRTGWYAPVYKHTPFELPVAAASFANDSTTRDSVSPDAPNFPSYLRAQYNSASPEYLFNLNPPQTADWPYSSPMRILRAILIGQIPVLTEKFHDHILEDVASLWDGKTETATRLGTWQLLDRQIWLADYMRSIEAYDREARARNRPFVSATAALARADDDNPSVSELNGRIGALSKAGNG
jgi:hypothetical protein